MTQLVQIKAMLDAIPVSALSYQEWVDVGMALHSEGLPCSLWDDWSRNDTRYHQGECDRKWRTFGHSTDNIVTIGTLYHMAYEYGYEPMGNRLCDWDDLITYDGEPVDTSGWHKEDTAPMPPPPVEYNAAKDITDYLSSVFDPEDRVCYVTNAYKDEDGKWKPYGKNNARSAKQLLDSLKKHPADMTDTFGTYNTEAGVWICFNPMDGEGRGNKNVTNYR